MSVPNVAVASPLRPMTKRMPTFFAASVKSLVGRDDFIRLPEQLLDLGHLVDIEVGLFEDRLRPCPARLQNVYAGKNSNCDNFSALLQVISQELRT